MATFQPENGISNQKSDFTRASQGFKADVSAGTMLESVATGLDSAVKAGASLFKEVIRNDITKSVDEIQNMFTGNGPTPGTGGDPKQDVPRDIVARGERLQALTDSYHSGRISGSHYWTLLDSEARAMRSKYAGHRELIDNIFQDLTGSVPANRLIAEIKSEANKKDAAAAEYRHWEDKAFGSPEYTAAVQQGIRPTQDQLKQWGSAWSLRKARTDVAMGELKYEEAQTEAGQKKAVNSVAALTTDIVQNVMRAGQVASNVDLQSLNQRAQEYVKAGKPIPTELIKSMEGLAAAADAEMTKQFEEFLRAPNLTDANGRKISLAQYLNPESMKKVRESFAANKEFALSPVRNADFGAMAYTQRLIKANDDGDLSNIMASEPFIRGVRATEKALGPQISAQYFNNNADFTSGMTGFAQRMMISKLTQPTTFAKDIEDTRSTLAAKGKSFDEPEVVKTTLQGYIKVIQDPKTPAEGRSHTISKLFSETDFYQKLDNDKDREAVYSMLVNPRTVRDVMAHGSEADKQKYVKWVDTVAGIRIGEPAQAIKAQLIDKESQVQVKYDPSTFSFVMGARPEVKRNPNELLMGADDRTYAIVKRAVDSLNNTMQGYAATAKALGKTPDVINQTLQRSMQAQGGFDIYQIKAQPKKPSAATPMSANEPVAKDPTAEEQPKP